MIKKIIKHTWLLIVLFSTIGGAFAFYQQLATGNDYSLSLFLKSSEKVIENNSKPLGLSMFFNGTEIKSLYLSKIQLKNTGKRALTKDFIYAPVTITTGASNIILQVNKSSSDITNTNNMITIKWELMNPKEVVEAAIFTTEPINLKINYKIKEVTKINYINEITNPPTEKRIKSLGFLWLFLIILSIVITRDALLIVLHDLKLQRIFNLTKSLQTSESIDRESFLAKLSTLYEDYYNSIPWSLVTPKELIDRVSAKLSSSEFISGRYLEIASTEIIFNVRHGNLYNIRVMNMLLGPLLFGFCVIKALISIFL